LGTLRIGKRGVVHHISIVKIVHLFNLLGYLTVLGLAGAKLSVSTFQEGTWV